LEGSNRLGMKDASPITISCINDSNIKTYIIEKCKLALNSAWNENLLREGLLRQKGMKFGIYSPGFDPKKKTNNMFGRHINHPE